MRALSPNLHSMLGSLTLLLGMTLLTACTSEKKPQEIPPEINTYNVYFDNNNNTLNYSIVQNNALISKQVDNFDQASEGFSSILALNTDDSEQGYEYAAYIEQRK